MDDEEEVKPTYIKAYAYMEELLCEASKSGNIALAARIMHERVDPNCRNFIGRSPLHFAAEYGNFEMIRLLLSNRAEIDPTDTISVTPLHLAARQGHLHCVQLLCMAYANVRHKCASGCTPRDLSPYDSETMCFLERFELGQRPKPASLYTRPSRLIIPAYAIPREPVKPPQNPNRKPKK